MDVTCAEMAGVEQQRTGFHTFVMTGDAIIRTNFNPFKPTRQLSYDPPAAELKDEPKVERSVSNDETKTHTNNNQQEEEKPPIALPHACPQNKEFIPGFMRVSETGEAERRATDEAAFSAEDSGIDVRLSDELEETLSASRHAPEEDQVNQSQVIEPPCDPAAVDEPSAKRLATHLYQLDGFKLTDVSHYLSKSDEFTQRVVAEFMSFFDFTGHPLVDSLRTFLKQISLAGGLIKEKETVLLHFTRRYLECNKSTEFSQTFHSEDSCHTLVCALVLLNTDLHCTQTSNPPVSRRLFIESLSRLNNGADFPKQFLTGLYTDVSGQPLFSTTGDENTQTKFSDAINYGVEPIDARPPQWETDVMRWCYSNSESSATSELPSVNQSLPDDQVRDAEMMKGYLLKKHCKGPHGVKTASGKRGWKRHFAILQDLKLILLKSDRHRHSRKAHKSIDLNNAYATVASYYTKRKYGFSLVTSDGSEFLFIAGSSEMREEWIDSINLTSAGFSREEVLDNSSSILEKSALHSTPMGTTRHMREQLRHYKLQVKDISSQLITDQGKYLTEDSSKKHIREVSDQRLLQQRLLQKYTTYVNILTKHLEDFKLRSDSIRESIAEEPTDLSKSDELYLPGSRISYRLAVYD